MLYVRLENLHPPCFISELQTWENEIMLELALIIEHLLQARVQLSTLHHCNFIYPAQQSLVVLTSNFILQRKEQTEARNTDATCLGLRGSERSTVP